MTDLCPSLTRPPSKRLFIPVSFVSILAQGLILQWVNVFFLAALLSGLAAPSQAQTASFADPQKGYAVPPPNQTATPLKTYPLPVSDAVIEQAKKQIDGEFPGMARNSVGGQVQPVWNESSRKEGYFAYGECSGCIYKIRTREYMVTSLILPRGLTIHTFDVGDSFNFRIRKRADNILAVQPTSGGVDTSLLVYTTEGEIYPFYLRAETFNSVNIPDLVVRIEGSSLIRKDIIRTTEANRTADASRIANTSRTTDARHSVDANSTMDTSPMTEAPDDKGNSHERSKERLKQQALADLASGSYSLSSEKEAPGGDYLKTAGFDPDRLRGWNEYELWGDGLFDEEDKRPVAIFRDDHFTYLQFRDRWTDLELPTGYVVVDGFDELVNSRVMGHTFIIESTLPLITLKSGKSYLCIRYDGESG